MQKTKLLQLFKAIKAEELREFTQFLKSPFYNRNQRVIVLYEYLKKWKKKPEDEKLDKKYAFKRLFPKGEKYEDWKMRELMSDLSKLIEEYFVVKEARQNDIERQMLLIKSLEKRRVNDYFFKYAHSLDEKLDKLKVKNRKHYLAQSQLQQLLYSATSHYTNKGSRELLSGVLYNTDMFYSLSKLHYRQEILGWERVRGEHVRGFINKEILENIPEHVTSDNLFLQIYQLFDKLFRLKQSVFYYEMKKVVLENITSFDKGEATHLLTILINSLRIALSDVEVFNEGFSLYKTGLAHGLFMRGDYFMIDHFNNIVSLASRVGEYQWTQDFINGYYTYLPQEEGKDNVAKLYTAHLNFLRKRYDDVEALLYTMEFEDFTYGLRHYTLLIRSLYELRRTQIDDKCKAFKVYLLRKNRARYISPDIREGHNNFIKIVELLFDTWGRFRGNDKAILIREKMNKMEKVEFRTWLDEKINELLNKVELRTNISK